MGSTMLLVLSSFGMGRKRDEAGDIVRQRRPIEGIFWSRGPAIRCSPLIGCLLSVFQKFLCKTLVSVGSSVVEVVTGVTSFMIDSAFSSPLDLLKSSSSPESLLKRLSSKSPGIVWLRKCTAGTAWSRCLPLNKSVRLAIKFLMLIGIEFPMLTSVSGADVVFGSVAKGLKEKLATRVVDPFS